MGIRYVGDFTYRTKVKEGGYFILVVDSYHPIGQVDGLISSNSLEYIPSLLAGNIPARLEDEGVLHGFRNPGNNKPTWVKTLTSFSSQGTAKFSGIGAYIQSRTPYINLNSRDVMVTSVPSVAVTTAL